VGADGGLFFAHAVPAAARAGARGTVLVFAT